MSRMARVDHALHLSPRDPRQVYWCNFLALGSLALGDWDGVLAQGQESQRRGGGGLDSTWIAVAVWFRSGCVRLVPERVSDTSGACVCGAGAYFVSCHL